MAGTVMIDFGEEGEELEDVQRFLIRYGYMSGGVAFERKLGDRTAEALRRFHLFYGLRERGVVTDITLDAVKTPRCGLRDYRDGAPLRPCPWPNGQEVLVYEFQEETSDLDSGKGFEAVEEAVDRWNDSLRELRIPLRIRRREKGDSEVQIQFGWNTIDRDLGLAGLPVAHADLPPDCGVITGAKLPKPVHFDDTHDWVLGAVDGRFDIRSVAMHEIGHILGLTHLSSKNHLMSPQLPANLIKDDLTDRDKEFIVEVYSRNEGRARG